MRMTRSIVVGLAVSTGACLSHWGGSQPASPATLACSLNELSRLGYLLSSPSDGSDWQQAYRERGGGGDQIWIRLVDDGRHAPWLDLRASSWNQFPQGMQPNGDARPFFFRSELAQEHIRTVLDACEGRGRGVVAKQL
jgi:hypothetical protein